jgi:hypothetical protein
VTKTLTITATVISAALALTACGSGSGSGSGSKNSIKGAQSGSPSPSASTNADPANVKRPDVTLPKGLKMVFEHVNTSDPVQEAVLLDNEDLTKAIDMAIAEGRPNEPALSFYASGSALKQAQEFVTAYTSKGMVTVGTLRYYDRKTTINSDGTATISYCEDQSKAFDKNLVTGKVDVTPVNKDSYFSYHGQMQKNDKGIWVTKQMSSQQGASACIL